jgi:hypothetical protein
MAENTEQAPDENLGLFELAIPVSSRVQIRDVLLLESRTKREPVVELSQDGNELRFNIADVGFAAERESNQILVRPSFVMTVARESGAESGPSAQIEATFVLIYGVDSFEGIEDRNVEAFAMTNGVFNAWPYWREFVQNAAARMGLSSSLIVPVFRF